MGISMALLAAILAGSSTPPADTAFIIVVDTTKAGSAAKHFVLPCYGSGYDADVDWGDGGAHDTLTGSPGNVDHTYAADGTYTVKIKENSVGGFPTIYFANVGDKLKLMQISQWGTNTWVTLEKSFFGCANLTITATDEATAKMGGVTNFRYAWCNCSGMTSFPVLDVSSGTDFTTAWYQCSGLLHFPALNMGSSTLFPNTWQGCTGLVDFGMVNVSSGIDFDNAWFGCIGLLSFPALDMSAAQNVSHAWHNCSGIVTFGAITLTDHATNLFSAWQNCNSMTSFPSIYTGGNSLFSETWADCTGLNGYAFPTLNMQAMTSGADCFRGVTLSTSSYSALIIDMALGVTAGVTFNGGGSHYNAGAVTAHDTLTVTRSWTITDGGTP